MPKCPYCDGNISPENLQHVRKGWAPEDTPHIYYCPYCEKILGIAKSEQD